MARIPQAEINRLKSEISLVELVAPLPPVQVVLRPSSAPEHKYGGIRAALHLALPRCSSSQ